MRAERRRKLKADFKKGLQASGIGSWRRLRKIMGAARKISLIKRVKLFEHNQGVKIIEETTNGVK